MTTLIIKHTPTTTNFTVTINNVPCHAEYSGHTLLLELPLLYGVHTLGLTSTAKVDITDVIVDGVSIKHTLYLGHAGSKITTQVYNEEWRLPFGNPVSQWIASCFKKFRNKEYGTNLYSKYDIFYPESVELPAKYPQILKDFFKTNFDFTAYPKVENPLHDVNVPYVPLNLKYNEQALLEEFTRNQQLIDQHVYKPSQVQANTPKPWQVAMVYYPGNPAPTVSRDDFPELFKLLESIDGIEIGWAFVGSLDAGSYVLPHVDDVYAYTESVKECFGCCQVYIPIGWEEGNYFKFHDVGLVPFNQGAILANTTNFTHASVNNSTKTRYTIGIICKFKNKDFLKYVSK
jgi:hypothetical protein